MHSVLAVGGLEGLTGGTDAGGVEVGVSLGVALGVALGAGLGVSTGVGVGVGSTLGAGVATAVGVSLGAWVGSAPQAMDPVPATMIRLSRIEAPRRLVRDSAIPCSPSDSPRVARGSARLPNLRACLLVRRRRDELAPYAIDTSRGLSR